MVGCKPVDIFTISSMRIFILICHFLSTLTLLWTRYPAVAITLSPNYSSTQYQKSEDSYLTVISFGIILLILEFSMMPVNYGKIYFRNMISMALDSVATFFNLWIILDGLSWKTYVPIFIFCVLLPTFWETLFVLPHVYRYLMDVIIRVCSYLYVVILTIGRFFEDLLFEQSND